MLERRQLLLQHMGIQSWIPKQQYVENKTLDTLWRDQSDQVPIFIDIPNHSTDLQSIDTKHAERNTIVEISPVLENFIEVEDIKPQTRISEEKIFAVEDSTHTINFKFDVLVHEKFLILTHIIDDDAQRRLFLNIKKACSADQLQLHWPLNIKNWNTSDQFVESYLQGFFAFHAVKNLILLGNVELPRLNLKDLNIHHLPSVELMLDSVEFKRNLWQKIYPYIYDIESNNGSAIDEKESRNL